MSYEPNKRTDTTKQQTSESELYNSLTPEQQNKFPNFPQQVQEQTVLRELHLLTRPVHQLSQQSKT